MNFRTNINVKKPELLKEALDRSAVYAVELIRDQARVYVPVDTGDLKESIQTKKIVGGYSVGPDTPYDIYVEFGTGMQSQISPPHYIYPIRAKFLSWIGKDGKRIFARRTKGAKAQPYLRPALDASRKYIADFLKTTVMKALREAGPMREVKA